MQREDLGFHPEHIPRHHRTGPAQVVGAQPDEAPARLRPTLDEQTHRQRHGMPPRCHQPAEDTRLGGNLVEMKWLGVKGSCKRLDRVRIQGDLAARVALPDGEVLQGDYFAAHMCLVLFAVESHPRYSLIVAANRDEFYDRPTASAEFWPDAPSVLAGRDLRAGGTWLGLDRQGRFAAVTNYRQGEREPPVPRSRGWLVSDFLTAETAAATHIAHVTTDAALYNGFNLIVGDARELWYFSNREGRARVLGPGVYGLSNHLLDTAWPKVSMAKRGLESLLAAPGSELVAELLSLLSDRTRPADDRLPSTGVGLEWERLLSSAFITASDYGTRSSTVLLMGRDGGVVFVERTFGTGGIPGGLARFEFQLDLPAGNGGELRGAVE